MSVQIGGPVTEHSWPRNIVRSIDCRKRDLIIRIADWTRDRDEPSYDVEVYVGGVCDWNLSEPFTRYQIQEQRTGLCEMLITSRVLITALGHALRGDD